MRQARLGEICSLNYGKALVDYEAEPRDESFNVRVFGTNGPIGWTKTPLCDNSTIIVGRKGAYRGVHFSTGPSWTIDTAYFLTLVDAHIDLQWMYYRLLLVDINRMDSGSAIPSTKREDFYSISVNVLPLQQQKRIAFVLSTYDNLIENNRQRIQLLEQSVRLLYKEWFVNLRFPGYEHVTFKDGVPAGWQKKSIADICDTVGGGTPSTKIPEYWDGNITWVVPSDVTNNDCLALLDSERKITERGLRESSARIVPQDTILMTSRASVGFFALANYPVCTNQGFINIIPHNDEFRMYLLFNLISRVREIRSNAKGTTFPEISKGRFRHMTLIVPNPVLVAEFSKFARDVIRQVRALKLANAKLEKARDLLLPRLMSGELAA